MTFLSTLFSSSTLSFDLLSLTLLYFSSVFFTMDFYIGGYCEPNSFCQQMLFPYSLKMFHCFFSLFVPITFLIFLGSSVLGADWIWGPLICTTFSFSPHLHLFHPLPPSSLVTLLASVSPSSLASGLFSPYWRMDSFSLVRNRALNSLIILWSVVSTISDKFYPNYHSKSKRHSIFGLRQLVQIKYFFILHHVY